MIARLLKERDAAQQQLQQQQQLVLQLQRSAAAAAGAADAETGEGCFPSLCLFPAAAAAAVYYWGVLYNPPGAATVAAAVAAAGISEELMEEMQSLARQLLSQRKKRKVVGFFVPVSLASSLACVMTLPLHSASTRGVYKVAPDTNAARHAAVFGSNSSSNNNKEGDTGEAKGERDGKVITVSAGADGSVVFFDVHRQKQLEKVQAHPKPCRSFLLHQQEPVLVTASDDKTCK